MASREAPYPRVKEQSAKLRAAVRPPGASNSLLTGALTIVLSDGIKRLDALISY